MTAMYKPRIIDGQVEEYLSAFGAVCIEGPKWCGKTWTSSYHSKSEIYIGDPAGNFQNRQLAELSPALVLEGEIPRLIDEWHEVPLLWDAVRYKVDQTTQKGQFILTGSATPNHKGILHSGAGRIARLRMRPMSLWESGDSSGKVSLERLCHGELTPAMTGEIDLRRTDRRYGENLAGETEEDPKGKPPAVLCVLCGMANAAYQRPDWVFVVPVTALKN